MRQILHGGSHLQFHIADGMPLNREHLKLVIVLVVALTVDVMKPATLGFVMPGVTREYEISKQTAGWLALVALTGTTVGSIVWGRMADAFGRRAAILLSALMFIGTAICGAMPSFEWNLAMCFLMGASAGGFPRPRADESTSSATRTSCRMPPTKRGHMESGGTTVTDSSQHLPAVDDNAIFEMSLSFMLAGLHAA